MPIKLIVTDIDGTLIDSPRCFAPSARNMEALRRARDAGITIAIASGRNLASCTDFARQIGFSGPIICNNGAEVWEGEKCYSRHCMDNIIIPFSLEFSRSHRLMPVIFSTMGRYIPDQGSDEANVATVDRLVKNDRVNYIQPLGRPKHFARLYKEGFSKILFNAESDEAAWNARMDWESAVARGELPPMEVTTSYFQSFEINPDDANKGTGVRDLGKALGLSKDEIMAVGDNENDVGMFTECEWSVVMDNARDEVKKKAKYVTASVIEDGLALAIEKYAL